MRRPPPRSTRCPSPTLFRSLAVLPAGSISIDGLQPVAEGDAATVTLRRTGGSFGAVSVNVDLIPGTASGTDFDPSGGLVTDRKSTRLNSSHANISYAVFCLK